MKYNFESEKIVPPSETKSRFAQMRETIGNDELMDKLLEEQREAAQIEAQSKKAGSSSTKKAGPLSSRKVAQKDVGSSSIAGSLINTESPKGPNTAAGAMHEWEKRKEENERVIE